MTLIDELRNPSCAYRQVSMGDLCREAADEIERLLAALDPFARHAHCVDQIQPSSLVLWCAHARNAIQQRDAVAQELADQAQELDMGYGANQQQTKPD
jgi:diaminopimelate decarboxylase